MFDVSNQPPPLEPYNLFASDVALRATMSLPPILRQVA